MERNRVGGESPFEIAARPEHDRIVEVRFCAPRYRLARGVPKDEIIRVVERVPARGFALEPEERQEPHDGGEARVSLGAEKPTKRQREDDRRTDGREVP